MRRRLRFIHVVASSDGFRIPSSNEDRWNVLDQLLSIADKRSARLLVLPGGYFTAQHEAEVLALSEECDRRVNGRTIALIGGIDLASGHVEKSTSDDLLVKKCDLPYFAFACGSVNISRPDASRGGKPARRIRTLGSWPMIRCPGKIASLASPGSKSRF